MNSSLPTASLPTASLPAANLPSDGLRGLHWPTDPSWWPPGPAWWISAIVAIAALVVILTVWRRRRLARRWQVAALTEWQLLQSMPLDNSEHCIEVVQACSRLLRRVALALRDRPDVAGLTGRRWLLLLDGLGHTNAYTRGIGRLLAVAPYQPDSVVSPGDARQLLQLVEKTIRIASPRAATAETTATPLSRVAEQ